MSRAKYRRQKIDTYVTASEITRLRAICVKYGFRSIYQLLQYLVYCFLRVADPEADPIDEPVPQEIENMFKSTAEWETRESTANSHEGMNMKRKPDQRKVKTANDLK